MKYNVTMIVEIPDGEQLDQYDVACLVGFAIKDRQAVIQQIINDCGRYVDAEGHILEE